MPVVTHTKQVDEQADGRRHVILRMWTNDPAQVDRVFFAGPDQDIDAQIVQIIAETNEQLAEDEYMRIIGDPEG